MSPRTKGWRGNPNRRTKWGINTTLSLGFGVGTICPLAGSRWAISLARYPASRSLVMSFSLTEEAIHLPCAPDPDMVECFLEAGKMRTWALELENGRAERERRR